DAGDGYGYEQGQYKHRIFTTKAGPNNFSMVQETTGAYQPTYRSFQVILFGLPFQAGRCVVDGEITAFGQEGRQVKVEVPEGFGEILFS
ncbi:MAG: DUF5110 domain-containing protein, partial [Phaeodactylibacter sp.]|nr:DUF5110 domain-containing protein [Phaeodactylibacter sp.]